MTQEIIKPEDFLQVQLPTIFNREEYRAKECFLEFFVAQIRNKNTRETYAQAIFQFMDWCDDRDLNLNAIKPIHVATYIETHNGVDTSVRLHLAAIRSVFNWLLVNQIVTSNPATPVKGPKVINEQGKTPILDVETSTFFSLFCNIIYLVMWSLMLFKYGVFCTV